MNRMQQHLRTLAALILLSISAAVSLPALAAEKPHAPGSPQEVPIREIFVPFEDLNVLLESNTNHVFLTREQFDDLKSQAKTTLEETAPLGASIVSANYKGFLYKDGVVSINGEIEIDVLRSGQQILPLSLGGVGLLEATVDDIPAAIGKDSKGRMSLFLSGIGRRTLSLRLRAPLRNSTTEQGFTLQVPTPPATSFELLAKGQRMIQSNATTARKGSQNADLIRRDYNEADDTTTFELMLRPGNNNISLAIGNQELRDQSVVVSRSVLINEITESYERLHATVSMAILHGAATEFRFLVPEGFDITDVETPLLSRFELTEGEDDRQLAITLREPARKTVVLNITAERTLQPSGGPATDEDAQIEWTAPQLVPLEVAGKIAVVGLLLDGRLDVEQLNPTDLIPIDNAVITSAIPPSVFDVEPGAPMIRPVAAFYSPQAQYSLDATFSKQQADSEVTTNLLLTVSEQRHSIRGSFRVTPSQEKLFDVRFNVPDRWHVTEVTLGEDCPLAFETYEEASGEGAGGTPAQHVRLTLSNGIAAGATENILFRAVSTPEGWLGSWDDFTFAFPIFAMDSVAKDTGALAVRAVDDMTAMSSVLDNVEPLDEKEKSSFGLGGVETDLAYRYERVGDGSAAVSAELLVERERPRMTAETFSFLKVEPEGLTAHYEIIFDVRQARARSLSFVLPDSTPSNVSIRGASPVKVKEFSSEDIEDDQGNKLRKWTALLAEGRMGSLRLLVDFEDRLVEEEPKDWSLPLVRASDVIYQTSLVALEGHGELDVQVNAGEARPVDVGKLAGADYRVGRRLLGAYGFMGEPGDVKLDVFRRPGYGLPPVIVERAELVSLMSTSGVCQTAARYHLRTKASFLEVMLPADAELWSILVDREPAKPQREGDSLLVSLPEGDARSLRDLQIVYDSPISATGAYGNFMTDAPRLFLRGDENTAAPADPDSRPSALTTGGEIPVGNLSWHLQLPAGYRMVRETGTVFNGQLTNKPLPISAAFALLAPVASSGKAYAKLAVNAAPSEEATAVFNDMDYDAVAFDSAEIAEEAAGRGEGAEGFERDYKTEDAEFEEEPQSAPGDSFIPPAPSRRPAAVASGPAATPAPALALPVQPQSPASASEPTAAGGKSGRYWALEGVGSLKIDVERQQTGNRLTFASLGSAPRLQATIVDSRRLLFLSISVALIVLLTGFAFTHRSASAKTLLVLGVVFLANLIPVLFALEHELIQPCTYAILAAFALVVYFIVVAIVKWTGARIVNFAKRNRNRGAAAPATAAILLVLACSVSAQQPGRTISIDDLLPMLSDDKPVDLPANAVIVPYVSGAGTAGITEAEKLLVPYETYVQLWNRAFPDKQLNKVVPTVNHALAGAEYRARLDGEDFLLLDGKLTIDKFAEGTVTVPLPIEEVVFQEAVLDGEPARIRVIAAQPPGKAVQQSRAAMTKSLVALDVSGEPGRKVFEFSVRLRLTRTGGWRLAAGRIPTAMAGKLAITVPDKGTELRLSGVTDQTVFESSQNEQEFVAALNPAGNIAIQWRPKLAEAEVDQSLTAKSNAVLDVQEDGLRVSWTTDLSFPRGRRDFFNLEIPSDYLVERVVGRNIRSWKADGGDKDTQRVEIQLLKEAISVESFTIVLARRVQVGADSEDASSDNEPVTISSFDAPMVRILDAALHTGMLQIRRSPLLELVTTSAEGVTRTDLRPSDVTRIIGIAGFEESPLGIRPFQAYRFVSTPVKLGITARSIRSKTSANLQTIVRITDRRVDVESQIRVSALERPIHRVEIDLPLGYTIDDVNAPGQFQWALADRTDAQRLSVFLSDGQEGRFSVVLRGHMRRGDPGADVALPSISVAGQGLLAEGDDSGQRIRQQGAIAVQIDPAYNATAADLVNCETALLDAANRWLQPAQRAATSLAITYRQSGYSGTLRVTPQKPDVQAQTFTNVRVTERSIEELIVIALKVTQTGIREFSFLLPKRLAEARVELESLRSKTVTDVPEREGYVRVKIQLQDDLMGDVRAVISSDRLVVASAADAPIPVMETGDVTGQFVMIENSGRDEIVINDPQGLEPIGRLHNQRRVLTSVLGESIGDAFVVSDVAAQPRLTFQTKARAEVRTAGARIGKAETILVMDASGAYRAQVEFRLNNDTEQFLEIQLPRDSRLWTASVAGSPVKPTLVPGAMGTENVRIPLVKTAEGDTDYGVVLKYGGQMPIEALMSKINFPLVHTTNINVELSQVRLRLPQSFRWFGFDGTMVQAGNEGDYRALDLKHFTEQFRLLSTALSSKNDYSKARAASNFERLRMKVKDHEQAYGSWYSVNPEMQRQQGYNDVTQQQAQQQVFDNRKQLEQGEEENQGLRLQRFATQGENSRSRRVVVDLNKEGNFKADEVAKQSAAPTNRFNRDWLVQNGLAVEVESGKKSSAESKSRVTVERLSQMSKSQMKQKAIDGKQPTLSFDASADKQAAAPVTGQQRDDVRRYYRQLQEDDGLSENSGPSQSYSYAVPDNNGDGVPSDQSYSVQVEANTRESRNGSSSGGGGMGGGGGFGNSEDFSQNPFGDANPAAGGAPVVDPFGNPTGSRNMPQPAPQMVDGLMMGQAGGQYSAPQQSAESMQMEGNRRNATGGVQTIANPQIASSEYLSSLDIALPLDGPAKEYFFTATRGKIEIQAKAISEAGMDRGKKLFAMFGLLGIAGVVTIARRRSKQDADAT